MVTKRKLSILETKVLEAAGIINPYNEEDGWVMYGAPPDIKAFTTPSHASPVFNSDGKEDRDNCPQPANPNNLMPRAKVGKRTVLGDYVSTPKITKTKVASNSSTIITQPFDDDKTDCSTGSSPREISVYKAPKDWRVTWYDSFQTKSVAGFPLPSAKLVASQAKEIAHWASKIHPNFAQVVLKDIGSVDLNHTNMTMDTSPFAIACLQGDVATVQRAIEIVCSNLKPPHSRQDKLRLLLEAHESGSWSPLLLIACAMVADKTVEHNPSLLTIAALLLQAGARPDSQDALGKSIVHYAAGCDANQMSMRLVDMCISASKSVNLYGKDVVLRGLTTTHLNGMKGVVGGYDYLTNRRSVWIPTFDKEVWVSAENIRLANVKEQGKIPLLVDSQDHHGDTVLHHIMKSDRNEIAHSLLHRYNASIHVKNHDGKSAAMMTLWHPTNSVYQMIGAFTRSEAEKARNAKKKTKNTCASCSESLGKVGMKCSKCLVTFYCSPECQTQHWKQGGHRLECKRLISVVRGIKLSSEHLDHPRSSSFGSQDFAGDCYVKPIEVPEGHKFVVAVQMNLDTKSLMIFSVCYGCQFQYKSTGPGYAQVLDKVQKEAAWDGCKTYMKASFDASGECTMYPATAGVKTDYWW